MKQQSAGRHVAPLGHITLIPNQTVFALSLYCCVLNGEATNTNFKVFGLTRLGLEPTIYRTWDEHTNHYTTDAVQCGTISILDNKGNNKITELRTILQRESQNS
jgi:hypothetical protein